jgi:hypothetical protein
MDSNCGDNRNQIYTWKNTALFFLKEERIRFMRDQIDLSNPCALIAVPFHCGVSPGNRAPMAHQRRYENPLDALEGIEDVPSLYHAIMIQQGTRTFLLPNHCGDSTQQVKERFLAIY